VTLKDLARLGEEVTKTNHLVNFRKCDAIWTVIEEFFRLRKGNLSVQEDSTLLGCIAAVGVTDMASHGIAEGALMEKSLVIEPPNAPLQSLKH
jgi:hypothetical protein